MADELQLGPALHPNPMKPFSHMITGVVLRAFAIHPNYRKREEVQNAGKLLKQRFFQQDKYIDRKGEEYWLRFSYPFWFTDLLSSLDSLALLGFSPDDPDIQKGLQWFITNQQEDGSWQLKLLKNKDKELNFWMCLAVCRVFKHFYS